MGKIGKMCLIIKFTPQPIGQVRQIPDPANTSPKTSTTGWLCEKCGNEGKRRLRARKKANTRGRRRQSSPPEIGPLQRGLPYCRNWQSLAQIVHLGRRKPAKRSVFTDRCVGIFGILISFDFLGIFNFFLNLKFFSFS